MAEDPEAKRAQGCETDAKESEYKQRIDNRRVHSERCKVETAESGKERIAERRRFRCLTSIIYERVARVLSLVYRYSARPRKKENVSLPKTTPNSRCRSALGLSELP